MQPRIDPLLADYDGTRINHLGNAVYLRLTTPRGSYWNDPEFGSLLHLIQREKDVERVALQAVQYAEEALQPILDDGRANRIEVTAERQPNRLALLIEVEDATGQVQHFEHPVKVS